MREQRHSRDLDAARVDMSAALYQTRDGIQALLRKLDALNVTQQFVIPGIPGTQEERNKTTQAPPRRQVNSTGEERNRKTARSHAELAHLQKLGGHYHEFTLALSTHFKRVGPISASLRSVDLKHRSVNLCLVVDGFKKDKKRVKLYEPVWINLSDRPRPVEVIINRINGNHVQGYLSEPKYQKMELAANQVRQRLRGGS